MFIIKNFLSEEEIIESLSVSMTDQWERNIGGRHGHYVPCRLSADLKKYPKLNEKFSSWDFQTKNRFYLARYEEDSACNGHMDPCMYTIIVLLEKPLRGGMLMLGKNNSKCADLDVGDAVCFYGKTYHYVTTVIEGKRVSLALWLNTLPDHIKNFLRSSYKYKNENI